MPTTNPERETVHELLDSIESDGWDVHEYEANVDPYDPLRVSVDLEYQPSADGEWDPDVLDGDEQPPTATLLGIIRELEGEHDEGAPATEAVFLAMERGMGEDTAWDSIEELKQMGEVYEPRTDHLRVT